MEDIHCKSDYFLPVVEFVPKHRDFNTEALDESSFAIDPYLRFV